jgi:predicted dehydrogenase
MRSFSRRRFFQASAALSAAAVAAPAFARSPRILGANDSVTLGFIGVGGMGSGLLDILKAFPDVRVAAVCDVYEPHALRAKEAAGGRPDVEHDFRKVLDRKDVDAVVIATPDHWHAIPTILACQAGKDVYCEKPLTYTIGEGRRVAEAAAKHNRVTQMGNLIHAGESYHRMAEIVQSGVLGDIAKVRVWMASRGGKGGIGKPADTAPPAGADYNFWLGPAPERPFNPNRFQFNWRYFWDYAGGQLADFVCHLVDPVHWGMKATAPETIVASGERIAEDNAETPDELEVVYHYPQGFDLVWSAQGHNGQGFFGRGAGIAFYGSRGTLHGHYNDYVLLSEGDPIAEPEPFLPRSKGHHREWVDAIKSRAECSCNFAYGHQLSAVAHLGNMALKTGKRLQWDAQSERVTNSPEANAYLFRPEYRAPWRLPDV